jgi:hypothetical protein
MSEGMEPEVKKYLLKILYSLCYGLLWLALNVLSGFYWGFGIIKQQVSISNILFFLWFLLSLGLLLYYYYRTWKKTF